MAMWTDIAVENAGELKDFYSQVFGWTVQEVPMEDEAGAGGEQGRRDEGPAPGAGGRREQGPDGRYSHGDGHEADGRVQKREHANVGHGHPSRPAAEAPGPPD